MHLLDFQRLSLNDQNIDRDDRRVLETKIVEMLGDTAAPVLIRVDKIGIVRYETISHSHDDDTDTHRSSQHKFEWYSTILDTAFS